MFEGGDGSLDVRFCYRSKGYAFSIEQVFETVRAVLDPRVLQREFFCPVRRAGISGMLRNLAAVRSDPGSINHITGDVYFLALSLPRQGLVLTVHDSGHIVTLQGWRRWFYRKFWFDLPTRRAAAVTFISEYSRRELEGHLGRKVANAVVIPDPVSDGFQFSEKAFPSGEARARVLALGTKPNKNLERLAAALSGLPVELRVIGVLRESQERAIREAGLTWSSAANLSFPEIVDEYRCADIVSLVSTHEGFGLPIIEAQASGRPVVAGSVCSMPEVAGEAAILVDPYDVSAIRGAFAEILGSEERRQRLVAEGLRNVERFRAAAVADQYFRLYQDLTAQSSKGGGRQG